MKVKQTYQAPSILPMQFEDYNICSASLNTETTEQFGQGGEFGEFWV